MSDVAAIVLAAGQGSRFRAAAGADAPPTKLVALHAGQPLVRHAAAAALGAALDPVVVVTGHAQAEVARALAGMPLRFAHNPDHASGMASSLKCGVAALPPGVRGVVVLLGDMPLVSAALARRLVETFAAHPDADAIVPVSGGVRGNPVLLSMSLAPALMRLTGDEGARSLLRAPGLRIVEAAIEDRAFRLDVDTPDHLRGL